MPFQGDDETPGVDFPGLLVPILLQISGVSYQHFFFFFKATFRSGEMEKLAQVSGISDKIIFRRTGRGIQAPF